MLQALIHSKHPKPDGDGTALTLKEDTLTASVFGRLRYVPVQYMRCIVQKIALHSGITLPEDFLGDFVHLYFWPRYVLDGRAYVEPDLVMEFDKAVIMVEAKVDNGEARQSPVQLELELASVRLTAAYEKKIGRLVALGGVRHWARSEDVWPISWRSFFHIIEAVLPQEHDHERLLVADIRSAMELHGVETRQLFTFSDFAQHCPRIQPVRPKAYLQGAME